MQKVVHHSSILFAKADAVEDVTKTMELITKIMRTRD